MEQAAKTAPLRVLVADDQDLVRRGFQVILNSYDNIEVVGLARDGEEAVELAQQLKPDVVLMDIRMPRKNGIEATRDIVNNPLLRKTHVLVLTTFDTDELVARGLNNEEIGQELFISPATVKTHLARIMGKTDAHDRAQLVVFAYESGLVRSAQ